MTVRKYLSEFAVNMQARQILVMLPTYLEQLTPDYFKPPYQCHIYGIARRPRVTLDPKSVAITPEYIRGSVTSHQREKPLTFDFEVKNYPPEPVTKCECEYPYTDLRWLDAKDEVAMEGPVVQYLQMCGAGHAYPELTDLELLYVGQAYGKEGSRMAPNRLTNHETLQKILAEAIHRSPDKDIWIVLFSFTDMLIASFDGRVGTYEKNSDEDLEHMFDVLVNPITEAQRINFCEAALIRYFQPQYNTEFKATFPSATHSSYAECYNLDLNSVTVELDTHQLGARFWTPTVPQQWVHLPYFPLHSEQERRSMFDFIEGCDPLPGKVAHQARESSP